MHMHSIGTTHMYAAIVLRVKCWIYHEVFFVGKKTTHPGWPLLKVFIRGIPPGLQQLHRCPEVHLDPVDAESGFGQRWVAAGADLVLTRFGYCPSLEEDGCFSER